MSEIESVEPRGERRAKSKTVAMLAQVIAVVAMLGGLVGTIYYPHSASLVVAFLAFVAYLISHHWSRR
jgi:uncharacterized protein YqgC (DUF456 family)